MRGHGRLSVWNDDRGFGFIEPEDGSPRVFAHISAFPQDKRRPRVSDTLNYEVDFDERGRPRARSIYFMVPVAARQDDSTPTADSGDLIVPSIAIMLLAAVLGLLVSLGRLHLVIYAPYVAFSLIAMGAYRTDKAAARDGAWRTPEATLHLLALVGGWPGALLAQRLYHHKTRKPAFRFVFWLTVLGNCAAVCWLVLQPAAPSD